MSTQDIFLELPRKTSMTNSGEQTPTSPPSCSVLRDGLAALAAARYDEIRGTHMSLDDVAAREKLAERLAAIITIPTGD